MKKIKELFVKYKEIITYIIFGVLTTIVSWGSYTVFVHLFKGAIPNEDVRISVSNVLSWIAGVAFAYVTNKLWVFESKSWKPSLVIKEIVSFVASRGITGVIEIVCVPLLAKTGFDNPFYHLVEKLGLTAKVLFTDGIYSKIALSVIVVILNYVFSKLFVFKNKKPAEGEEAAAEEANASEEDNAENE